MSKAAPSTRSTARSEPSESCAFARELSTALNVCGPSPHTLVGVCAGRLFPSVRARALTRPRPHQSACGQARLRLVLASGLGGSCWPRVHLEPEGQRKHDAKRRIAFRRRATSFFSAQLCHVRVTFWGQTRRLVPVGQGFRVETSTGVRRNSVNADSRCGLVTSASRFGVRPDDLSQLDGESVPKRRRNCDRPERRLGRSGPSSPSTAGKQPPGSLPSARRAARPSSATRRHRRHGPALQASARRGP
jgi:hypothetical protein